ncbi:MAG: hypothetical protein WD403_15985, partial [Pirellulales bacterium]
MDTTTQQTIRARPARLRRRWLQFSLRWLLVIVTLSGIGLGLVVRRAERQRKAVAEVRATGGTVSYTFVRGDSQDWLCRLLGVDYFAEVTRATLADSATDATVAHLSGLTSLGDLSLHGTRVTDAGLAHVSGLTGLQVLDLGGTRVSNAGLAHLSGLTGLQVLYLGGTQVTDAGLAH